MSRWPKWLVLLLVFPFAAGAQVDIRCRLAHTTVILYESIPMDVTIVNNTGQPLTFGVPEANAALMFDIERSPGALMMPTGASVWTGAVTVAPMGTLKQTVDLLPAYPILNTGPYSITARLEWSDRAFISSRMFLDVVPGFEVARETASVPGMGRAIRTYTLRTLNRDKTERLFLRIDDDDEGRCYGVFDLGRVVRMYKPNMEVDEEGDVHALHQAGPSFFVRHVFTPYGLLVSREQYSGDATQMRMSRQAGSGVVVEGIAQKLGGNEDGPGGETVEFEDLLR